MCKLPEGYGNIDRMYALVPRSCLAGKAAPLSDHRFCHFRSTDGRSSRAVRPIVETSRRTLERLMESAMRVHSAGAALRRLFCISSGVALWFVQQMKFEYD